MCLVTQSAGLEPRQKQRLPPPTRNLGQATWSGENTKDLWEAFSAANLALRWGGGSQPPWCLASEGPLWGQLCGPSEEAERFSCLFAEGGKTTPGLLIQPHLGVPRLLCSPGAALAPVTEGGGGAGSEQGGCWGVWRLGNWPAFPQEAVSEEPGVLTAGRGSGPQGEVKLSAPGPHTT